MQRALHSVRNLRIHKERQFCEFCEYGVSPGQTRIKSSEPPSLGAAIVEVSARFKTCSALTQRYVILSSAM